MLVDQVALFVRDFLPESVGGSGELVSRAGRPRGIWRLSGEPLPCPERSIKIGDCVDRGFGVQIMSDASDLTTAMTILGGAIGVAKPVLEAGCRLLENVLGKPLKVAGGMLADQLYVWQWENRINFANRAQQLMDENGVAAKVLPRGFLIPLLEAAGNVDDPELQEMWARLLVSAVERDANHPAYVHLLRQLSPDEAIILNAPSPRRFVMNEGKTPDLPNPLKLPPEQRPQVAHWINVPDMMESLRYHLSTSDVALVERIHRPSILLYATHLKALGIIATGEIRPHNGTVPEHILELHDTEFGKSFVDACCSRRVSVTPEAD